MKKIVIADVPKVWTWFASGKTSEDFVVGEGKSSTYVGIETKYFGKTVWVEGHWKWKIGGVPGNQTNPSYQMNATLGVVRNPRSRRKLAGFVNWISFIGDSGDRFKFWYVVKFPDGNIGKSNTLRGRLK